MYEDFRKDLLLEMSKSFDGNREALLVALGAVDRVAANYSIETKVQALVPASKLNEETLALYLADLNLEGKAKGTLTNKYYLLAKFFQTVKLPLTEITTNDIRAYLYVVKNQTSESNEEKVRQGLSAFFEWCIGEDIITKNPCKKIKKIKVEKPQIQPLTAAEMQTMFNCCKTKYELALISFLYATGARISEAASVKIADLKLDAHEVHLFGKNKKHRTAYLSDDAVENIKAYLAVRHDKYDRLFPGDHVHGDGVKAGALRQTVQRIAQRGGLDVNPHQIRHTTATDLQEGMPIQMVSDYLGHENITTTMIYTKINRTDLKAKYAEIMNKGESA